MLPPEGTVLEVGAPEVGLVAGARLEEVITTASLGKAGKSAWCRREHEVYAAELAKLARRHHRRTGRPELTRASPRATYAERKRIK